MNNVILDVINLRTSFFTKRGTVKAVNGISFSVEKGKVVGIVGESGSGKTMTCLSIVRLVPGPAGRITGGQILFEGEDILKKTERDMRCLRGKKIAMILQDPMTSLNPVFTIGEQVAEAIRTHQTCTRHSIRGSVEEILSLVRIPSPEVRLREYPHQMSGGMQQRVVTAMALSCRPQLIIADEPTTALDLTIQAQILDLLEDIKREYNISMIIVTHDLGIVARMCDNVVVMYAGNIVEKGGIEDIFDRPAHPYTSALMKTLPRIEARKRRLPTIEGEPPDLCNLPHGCAFALRCSKAIAICQQKQPPERVVADGHVASCWLLE